MHARNATLKVTPLLVNCRCKQEVADRVPARCARLSRKSEAQQIGGGGLCIREGHEAVPQITNGRDAELLAQHAR